MAKYRFKKQFEDAKISVAIMHKVVTKDNLTDEDVEFLAEKFPNKFDHNFEEIPSEPEKVEASKPKANRKPKAKKAE